MAFKKTIEGYFVREAYNVRFSMKPYKDDGYYDDADCWHAQLETDGKEYSLDGLDDALQLCRDVSDNIPHRCRITIELEPVEYESCRNKEMERLFSSLYSRLSAVAHQLQRGVVIGSAKEENTWRNTQTATSKL